MGPWEVHWEGKKNAVPSEKSHRTEPSTPAWWPALALLRSSVTSDAALVAANGLDRRVGAPKGRGRRLPAVTGNARAGLGGVLAWPLSPPGKTCSPDGQPEVGGSMSSLQCAQGTAGVFSPVGSSLQMLASCLHSGKLPPVCACASSEPRSKGCEGSWQPWLLGE